MGDTYHRQILKMRGLNKRTVKKTWLGLMGIIKVDANYLELRLLPDFRCTWRGNTHWDWERRAGAVRNALPPLTEAVVFGTDIDKLGWPFRKGECGNKYLFPSSSVLPMTPTDWMKLEAREQESPVMRPMELAPHGTRTVENGTWILRANRKYPGHTNQMLRT